LLYTLFPRRIPCDSQGSRRGFLGVRSKLQNVQRELKNAPHVKPRASLETKVSGPNPQPRRIPCDSQGSRRGFLGVRSKLQNVKRELKNAPHVKPRASLETKDSGPTPQLRRIPCDSQGSRRGFLGVHPWESLGFHGILKTGNRPLQMGPTQRFQMQFHPFEADLSVCKNVLEF
jgi:hypothetical protein